MQFVKKIAVFVSLMITLGVLKVSNYFVFGMLSEVQCGDDNLASAYSAYPTIRSYKTPIHCNQ